MATAIRGIKALYVLLRMMSPPLVKSWMAMYPDIEASFHREINSLHRVGSTVLNAWGMMMYHMVWA